MHGILIKTYLHTQYVALGALSIMMFSFPVLMHAQVVINEIMYAPEGSDTKHEWVEVCNISSPRVDLTNWTFYENDTNHGIKATGSTSQLDSNVCGIIADDADTFSVDYPSFHGVLFDSTFSLKNTGETISLKDESGVTIDTAVYSDALGAKDDGNSLHVSGTSFITSSPTPGKVDGESSTSTESSGGATGGATGTTIVPKYTYQTVTIQPPEDIHIRVPKEIITTEHAMTSFHTEVYDETGAQVKTGNIQWTFGDGASATGRTVTHQYIYSGVYTAVVHISDGFLEDTQYINIKVVPLEATLVVSGKGDWVDIYNKSENPLDISRWRLLASGQYFIMPENTVIQSNNTSRFPKVITKLRTFRIPQEVTLVYPDGKVALVGTFKKESIPEVAHGTKDMLPPKTNIQNTEKNTVIKPKVNVKPKRIPISISPKGGAVIHTQKNNVQKEVTPKVAVTQNKELPKNTQTAAAVITLSQKPTSTTYYWYLLLVLVLSVVAGAIVIIRKKALIVEGFEVVD